MDQTELSRRTIADFGAQWTTFVDNDGNYGSVDYFFDIVSPLLMPHQIRGASVADIGSGTGRIVMMLARAGARFIHTLEPSDAFDALVRNTESFANIIVYQRARGDELPAGLSLDVVTCIGVIHHIPDPSSTMRAAYAALRPGGTCFVWLYAYEGNQLYLACVEPLRKITTHLPDLLLRGLCHVLTALVSMYARAARLLPLPLATYMRRVFAKLDRRARYLVVFDQLNPTYTKYYRAEEATALFANAGFIDISLHRRHDYSWAAIGRKPHSEQVLAELRDGSCIEQMHEYSQDGTEASNK